MDEFNPRSPVARCEHTKVPASVLRHVEQALAWLREIRAGVDSTIQSLDEGMGGNGRYEADALANRAADIASAMRTIDQFRQHAPANGVDAATVLQELGGIPDFTPSTRALAWMKPAPVSAAGKALEVAFPMGYRSTDTAP